MSGKNMADGNTNDPAESPEKGADPDAEEYSRRGFMETAGAMGAAGATAGLAGCIGGDDSEGTSEGDFLWWTMRGYIQEEEQALRDTAAEFEDWSDEEVNLTTEVITWDQVFESWASAIQGRNTPNVSEMANEHAVDYGDRGVVRPNTELFNQFDDWYDTPSYWGNYEDDVWGFPWFVEVRNFYANTEILNEAGHDGTPETWQEMISMAQDVTDETDYTGFVSPGAQSTGTGQVLYGATVQSGGEFYNYEDDQWTVELDSPTSLFSHLWMASLQEEWDIAPGGWAGMDGTDAEQLYREGEAAFMVNSGDAANNMVSNDEDIADVTNLELMPEGPAGNNTVFMGGSCLSVFESDYTEHDVDDELSLSFIEYMTSPDTMEGYYPDATPNFLPVREAQEEIPPFTENPTDIPDEWIQNRLDQASDSARYGITGPQRNAPFLGDLEGSLDAYSVAISGILGADQDPGQAIVDQANQARQTINESDAVDYELEENTEAPSVDDIPSELQDWVEGNGDTPQIWTPDE